MTYHAMEYNDIVKKGSITLGGVPGLFAVRTRWTVLSGPFSAVRDIAQEIR
ncbi:MAG: hypothetical protein WC712_05675 [Candidatus Brocadiia bacterium]